MCVGWLWYCLFVSNKFASMAVIIVLGNIQILVCSRQKVREPH